MTPNTQTGPAGAWWAGRVVSPMLVLSFAIAVGMGLYALVQEMVSPKNGMRFSA